MVDKLQMESGSLPEKDAAAEDKGQQSQRPDWLPEKFTDGAALAKAYAELETKLGAPKGEAAPKGEKSENPNPLHITRNAPAEGNTEVDLDAVGQEFVKNGSLSDETYEKLAKAGYNRQTVDRYIEGQQAIAREVSNEMAALVGGAEPLQEILTWAGENLSPEAITEFNSAVDQGNRQRVSLLLRGIQAEYAGKVGKAPNLIGGDTGAAKMAGGFKNAAQVVVAMRDPRYQTDSAYRDEVKQRLALSEW